MKINGVNHGVPYVDFGLYADDKADFQINVDEQEWKEYIEARNRFEDKHFVLTQMKRTRLK